MKSALVSALKEIELGKFENRVRVWLCVAVYWLNSSLPEIIVLLPNWLASSLLCA